MIVVAVIGIGSAVSVLGHTLSEIASRLIDMSTGASQNFSDPNTPLWVVTGAAGFLGNNLVSLLLERSYQVRACVSYQDELRPLRKMNCETVAIDVRDETQVSRATVTNRGS